MPRQQSDLAVVDSTPPTVDSTVPSDGATGVSPHRPIYAAFDEALSYLERCRIEKRLSWLDKNLESMARTGNPLDDAVRIFYEVYLGLSIPEDGEIIERTDTRLVTRWWNQCPTLEACKNLGLDTRQVCTKAQHAPVQVFLSRIDPRLKFDRDYDRLRPLGPYCEEIITLEE